VKTRNTASQMGSHWTLGDQNAQGYEHVALLNAGGSGEVHKV